jgi:hypothetical protein
MPTVQDAQTLRITTNRPILGMVSMLPTEALRRLRRRSTIFFASGLGALIAAFGGVLAFALLIGRAA